MRTYATMLRSRPDFFVHCGDSIYADCAIPAQQNLPNGETWRNIITEEKSKVATTLAEYRGNYKYNLLDANLRAFNAEVPIFAQWDNHEVMEDWWPGEAFDRRGYGVKSALLLAARGCRAFHEFMPLRYIPSEPGRIYRKISYGPLLDLFLLDMRSYRGPNESHSESHYSPDTYLLGPAQVTWLKRELRRSTATWKVIASDTPLGTITADSADAHTPLGRGIEIADLLSFMQRDGIRNTIWITADLHYTAAHYFDPNNAVFQDFEPFWEFVSGPIHAGTWTPSHLDSTFGPRVIFQNAASREQGDNLAPCFGLQFFGHVTIDGTTGVLTVTLKNVEDRTLWSTSIEPESDQSVRVAQPLPG
jgi:alkaline phosphatase D